MRAEHERGAIAGDDVEEVAAIVPISLYGIVKRLPVIDTLDRLSRVAREEYGLAGCVQHGASTLPEALFDRFPQVETAEIHLATGFQNLLYEHGAFPRDLRAEIGALVVHR